MGAGTKPILLPENQTFSYNSADLEQSAVDQLQKLGMLIQRNSKASFTIEGYTDSFGPADYNHRSQPTARRRVKRFWST